MEDKVHKSCTSVKVYTLYSLLLKLHSPDIASHLMWSLGGVEGVEPV